MREPIVNRDTGDETLFDPDLLAPNKTCECGAQTVSQCRYAVYWNQPEHGRRPKTCLRRIDPATAPFPEGF